MQIQIWNIRQNFDLTDQKQLPYTHLDLAITIIWDWTSLLKPQKVRKSRKFSMNSLIQNFSETF